MQQIVRLGPQGWLGQFHVVESVHFPRGTRVICRTARGLEVGTVLATADVDQPTPDGSLLRVVSVTDDLLIARLEHRKQEAIAACQELLDARRIGAILVDAEFLFDGRTLCFYFLGEVSPELDQLTAELAEAYEAEAQLRRFTDSLMEGCGPHCGTPLAEGQGCSSSGCSSCGVAGWCGSGQRGTGSQKGS